MARDALLTRALAAIVAGARPGDEEGPYLDFKRQGRSRKDTARDIAESAMCFANAAGGFIVIGVADAERGPEAFLGSDIDPAWLARQIYELTQPALTVNADLITRHGVPLLVVQVPQGVEVHSVGGRTTRRRDTSCLAMTPDEIARLVEERRGHDWSKAATDHGVDAVSAVALAQARTLLRQHPDPQRRSFAAATDADLLRLLNVVGVDGRLNQAGKLLFCESDPVDARDVVTYQYRRTVGGEPADIVRVGPPLLTALIRVRELIDARLDKTPVLLPDGQQLLVADLPEAAVREALANALIHRDYRLPGPVHVEHAPTQIVVTSPGPLVSGVTPENILVTPSRPRNRALTSAVRTLGLVEEAGVGVDRMYREMIRVGHQPPAFVEEYNMVRVTLRGGAPSKPIARFVSSLPAAESDDAVTMLVLFTLLTQPTCTCAEMAPVVQRSEDETEDALRRLAADRVALIEPTRDTARLRRPTYRLREHVLRDLGPAVAYRRRTADQIDRKVIAAVGESGEITGRLVQLLLDVDASRASRILADLVQREILVRTTTHSRGPGVRYGRGPKFPRTRTR